MSVLWGKGLWDVWTKHSNRCQKFVLMNPKLQTFCNGELGEIHFHKKGHSTVSVEHIKHISTVAEETGSPWRL